jgi:tetratricopeptide (TPR) repeat protein
MSRFKNLELGGQDHEHRVPSETRSAQYYLREAEKSFFEADFEAALRAYGKVLEFQPDEPAAWVGQVRMLIELKDFEQAKSLADRANQHLPNHPEILAARAVALARERQIEAALAFSDAAVEAGPETAFVWLARGDVLLASGNSQSEFCFQRAIALSPGSWLTHWLASRIHFVYEKFSLALKYAQQALALDAAQSPVWLQLGRCQEALGLSVPAQNSFAQALQLNPNSSAAKLAQAGAGSSSLFHRLTQRWRRLLRQ